MNEFHQNFQLKFKFGIEKLMKLISKYLIFSFFLN
jgi:hypothetical protein